MKILVVQPDLIGDVVLTSPFLRELKKLYPQSKVTLVVHPDSFNLVELCPYADEIIKYDCERIKWFGNYRKFAKSAIQLSKANFEKRKFDLALFPHWDTDNYGGSFLCALSKASSRLGFSQHCNSNKDRLNKGFDKFFTETIITKTIRHEVEQKLFMLEHLGLKNPDKSLELWLNKEDEKFASEFLVLKDKSRKLIAFGMGASLPRKKWPIENYIETARQLKKDELDILIVGSSEDIEDAQKIKSALKGNIIDSTGNTTLRQAAALLKHCYLYIGNDTGPMHLAAAQDVPCIVVSCHPPQSSDVKPLSPIRFGPWQVKNKVLRPHPDAPMHTRPHTDEWHSSYCDFCSGQYCTCIDTISTDRVLEAVGEFF